uniref:Solute carrier family 39 member 1 n=1 Tax=Eptatretus burgeri TaxID=7764 RepID=A0A8C4R3W9_EPTBU
MDLLGAKILALLLLLLLTLLFGVAPISLLNRAASEGVRSGSHARSLSLASCFVGGVFLGTCLLDLLPDSLSGIHDAVAKLGVQIVFPLPEFVVAIGFFVVLLIEQIFLHCHGNSTKRDEERSLLIPASDDEEDPLQRSVNVDNDMSLGHSHGDLHQPRNRHTHLHVDAASHSPVRSLVLVLSLSLHSIFEGLAVGLQSSVLRVLELVAPLVLHKVLIAFSLCLKLVQGGISLYFTFSLMLLFAVMSPLGVMIGIGVTQAGTSENGLVRSLLEGFSTGTFIYITFLEVLPHELNTGSDRLLKVLILISGFSAVTAIVFFTG